MQDAFLNPWWLPAAGAGRQHATAALVGASGRPLNFTVMRHPSLGLAPLGLLAALASCATHHAQDYRALCAQEDTRAWRLATKLPSEMTALRAMADANSVYRAHGGDFAVESYFTLPTGEFMLCRSDRAPKDSCGGEWWQFEKRDSQWRMVRHDAWICVD